MKRLHNCIKNGINLVLVFTLILSSQVAHANNSPTQSPQQSLSVEVPTENGQKINVQVDMANQEALNEVSPSKLQEKMKSPSFLKEVKEMTMNFPMEAIQFYSVIGAFAIYDCTVHYQNNPSACMDFFGSLGEPLTYISFYSFLLASHTTNRIGMVLGKSKILTKSGFASRFLWGQMGLASGSFVSGFIDELARDPNLSIITKLMWRKKTPEDQKVFNEALKKLEERWFTTKEMRRFIPQMTSLLSAALASHASQSLIKRFAYKKTAQGFALRPFVARFVFKKGILQVAKLRWMSGPINLIIFIAWDRILAPIVETVYEDSKFNHDFSKVNKEFLEVSKTIQSGKASAQDFKRYEKAFNDLMKLKGEWREHSKKDYTTSTTGWQTYTARFFAEVESTYRFYKSFLLNKNQINVSTENFHVYNTINAINFGAVDWFWATKTDSQGLYQLTTSRKYGLMPEYYLRSYIFEPVPLSHFQNHGGALSKINYNLQYTNELDRELIVQAINLGMRYEQAQLLAREELQKEVEERKNRSMQWPTLNQEVEELLLPESWFHNDPSKRGLTPMIGGIPYHNITEKLLVSMACGPQIDNQKSDFVDLPFLGLGVPRFFPPSIVQKVRGDRACNYINNINRSVYDSNDQEISFIEYIKRRINKDFQNPEKFDESFKKFVLPQVDTAINKFDEEQRDLVVEKLSKAYNSEDFARPIQYLGGQEIQLPRGIKKSLELDLNMLIRELGNQTRSVLPQKQLQELSDYTKFLKSLFEQSSVTFSASNPKWSEYFKMLVEMNPNAELTKKRPSARYIFMANALIGDIETILSEGFNELESSKQIQIIKLTNNILNQMAVILREKAVTEQLISQSYLNQ